MLAPDKSPSSAAMHIEVSAQMLFQVVELMLHKVRIGATRDQGRPLLRSDPVGKDDDMDMRAGLGDRAEGLALRKA